MDIIKNEIYINCIRCRSNIYSKDIDLKKNGSLFKTCSNCRTKYRCKNKKKVVVYENDNNINYHLVINDIINVPYIENLNNFRSLNNLTKIREYILNNNIIKSSCDIDLLNPNFIINKNNILNNVVNVRYFFKNCDDDVFNYFLINCNELLFYSFFLLSHSHNNYKMLFSPDDHIIFNIESNINIFKNYWNKKEYINKFCYICYENKNEHFFCCGQCNKIICIECFYKMSERRYCPYCKYSLIKHIYNICINNKNSINIDILYKNEKDIIKYNDDNIILKNITNNIFKI